MGDHTGTRPETPGIEALHSFPRFEEDSTLEQCPVCGRTLGGPGHQGPVYDAEGREFDHLYDTEPDQGPYYCPDCWQQYEVMVKQHENAQLTDFHEHEGDGGTRKRKGNMVWYDDE